MSKIINCQDCKYFKTENQWCILHDVPVIEEMYCTKAERRSD